MATEDTEDLSGVPVSEFDSLNTQTTIDSNTTLGTDGTFGTEQDSLQDTADDDVNFDHLIDGIGDDDEQEVFSNPDVLIMYQRWITEKHAPELLMYYGELVDVLKEQVKNQEEMLEDNEDENPLAKRIKLMEIDRIRYVLHEYHRVRLQKIERHFLHLLQDPDRHQILSEHEIEYLKTYTNLLESHFNDEFLLKVHKTFRSLTSQEEEMVDHPNLNKHVFVKITQNDIGTYDVGDSQTEDLREKSIWIARYGAFRELVANDKAILL